MSSLLGGDSDRLAPDGPALLERAVGYARSTLSAVGPLDLSASTPCVHWDLRALLGHLDDSLATFTEAAEVGYLALGQLDPGPGTDRPRRAPAGQPTCTTTHDPGDVEPSARQLADRLRGRACALLAAWARTPDTGVVGVADRWLGSGLLAATGALEVAVHGWDVGVACGARLPLPDLLARDLLDVVPLLVDDTDRPARFAERIVVPRDATPPTRLLALVGRRDQGTPG